MTRDERVAISILNAYKEGYESAIEDYKQEPCDVSVSEKEPNEISEEVTLRFFKDTLKVRWHDFVIYNVEWLKKNWQMEMDIVCGVKPCDDAISRDAVMGLVAREHTEWDDLYIDIAKLPSVTQKSGKWLRIITEHKCYARDDTYTITKYKCSECGAEPLAEGASDLADYALSNYCPNCGCRMVEPQESEDKE